ncbi:hypothetical protein [Staphylococcus aureus]|uniref:hypothetical protein n=1 Tax=Staphylococcus aureus TaxID=1280 RepID=UPI001EFF3198|nr:hypothetical protein [Staphylococcus aureus]ULW15536.1 hypothetical protein IF722_13700 [Staphylococcus aureus]
MTVPGYPTDAAKQPTFKVTDPSTLPDGKQQEKQMFQLSTKPGDSTRISDRWNNRRSDGKTAPVTTTVVPENNQKILSTAHQQNLLRNHLEKRQVKKK